MSCASPAAAVVCVFLAKPPVKALGNKDGKESVLRALICTYIRCVTHTRKESNFQVRLASSMHSPKLAVFIHISFKMLQDISLEKREATGKAASQGQLLSQPHGGKEGWGPCQRADLLVLTRDLPVPVLQRWLQVRGAEEPEAAEDCAEFLGWRSLDLSTWEEAPAASVQDTNRAGA